MTPIHPDFAELVAAAEVLSPTTYVVLGETHRLDDPAAVAHEARAIAETPSGDLPGWALDEQMSEAHPLVQAIRTTLYSRLYTRSTPAEFSSNPTARRSHCGALSEANSGNGSWEPGWQIAGEIDETGRVPVRKGGVTFWALPAGVRTGAELCPGTPCRVRVPKEFRNLVPGFYSAIGDPDLPEHPVPLLRLYWHLTASAAVPFLRSAATLFNAGAIPFRVKVLSDPATYNRADAGVLFLAREDWGRACEVIRDVYHRVAPELRSPVPMFTKQLALGLGLAEDPSNGQTFGQHRCGLAALALWRAFQSGIRGTQESRLAALLTTFRDVGLDPTCPFLNPGSKDEYQFEFLS